MLADQAAPPRRYPTEADRAELGLAALPPEVEALLLAEGAPPRLVAHLTLVHDVALRLVAGVAKAWPRLSFDKEAVAFGAATHDIGKARHPNELSGPGHEHEAAGERLLLEHGFPVTRARFARTHGEPPAGLPLEDLLVVLADTAWKAKRSKEFDDRLVAVIADASRAPAWDVFMRLDGLLSKVAKGADDRLAWQGAFSVA